MGERKAAKSRTVKYETAECVHCEAALFIDDEMKNVDEIPEGINVVITGGEHISADRRLGGREYIVPRVVAKLFTKSSNNNIKTQYMCPACAESIYGYSIQSS